MCRSALVLFVALCSVAAGLRGDALVLHNDQRIEGEIIGGTANTIHIRRANDAGGKYVDVIDRADVARIEREPKRPAARSAETEPQPGTAGAQPNAARMPTGPAAAEPAAELSHATHRALIVAIAKWRAEDFVGAGLDLSRIINSASPGQREAISAITQATIRRPLAEFAAEIHLRAAIATRRGSAIRVPYVTEYEKSALIPMLVRAYETTLGARGDALAIDFTAPPPQAPARPLPSDAGDFGQSLSSSDARPWYSAYAQSRPASGPADDSDGPPAVGDLLARPERFEGSAAEARVLAPRVYQALSLLNERIRLDPAIRRNADLKRRLMADKQALLQLAKTLEVHSRRPAPQPPADPAALAAEEARREELARRLQEAQQAEARRVAEARESARKWQEEQEKQQKGFSLFDWLKPADQNQPPPASPAPQAETPAPSSPN